MDSPHVKEPLRRYSFGSVGSEPSDSSTHQHGGRQVLVPVDDSDASQHALAWALAHLHRRGDRYHLVHVIPTPETLHPWTGVYTPPDDGEENEEFKEAASMIRRRFVPILAAANVHFDAHVIVAAIDSGTIAKVVMEKAEEVAPSYILVASHGKGRLKEMWLGSVSSKLTRETKQTVVVVK